MKKKRLTVLALMTALLMVLSLAMLVACDKAQDTPSAEEEETVTIEATKGLLISNSDFKVVDTTKDAKYPLSMTGWTGATMYSGSFPTGVIAGAVSLEEALYSANKSTWNDTDNTVYNLVKSHYSSAEGAINNALMIYMPTKAEITDSDKQDYGPTAYGYTSSSFSLAAGTYYKFSVDVLTYKIAGVLDDSGNQKSTAEPGARIYISSNTYAEYAQINTNGAWTTYTVYFESAANAATALTVQLGLGKASSSYTENGLTTGYAFFDNVNLEEVEKSVYDTAKTATEDGVADPAISAADYQKTNQTVTLKTPNGRFDFGSTSVGYTAAASNWSIVTGNSSEDDPAPSNTDAKNGIIDVSKFADNATGYSALYYQYVGGSKESVNPAKRLLVDNVASIISAFGDKRLGNNVYMLSQQMMTAQGLKSSKQIVVEKGKHYAISVSVYTYDVRGAGVTLTLTGNGNPISIKGISQAKSNDTNVYGLYQSTPATTGAWQTYTFYIEGNQYVDTAYNMTFWLGTGGTNENTKVDYTAVSSGSTADKTATTYTANGTFSTGWAFFDEFNLTELTATQFNDAELTSAAMMKDADKDGVYSYASSANFVKVSLKTDNLFVTGGTGISADFNSVSDDPDNAYDNGTLGTPAGFTSEFDAADNTLPVISADHVTAGVINLGGAADYYTGLGIADPGKPYDIESMRALMISADTDSYYLFNTIPFTVKAGNFYRISMWIKTVDVKSTSGLYVYLLDDEDATKSSFTLLNTTDYTDDEEPSEWKEYTFYVRGGKDDDEQLHLKFTFGTGTRWTSDTLASGEAFIANLSMTSVTYTDYTGVSTGTAVKTVNLYTSTTNTFTNSGFDNYSYADTKGLDGSGKLDTEAGVPESWTLSDSTYAPLGDDVDDSTIYNDKTYVDDDNLVAGIVTLDKDAANAAYFRKSTMLNNLFGSAYDAQFNALYGTEDDTYFANAERLGGPNLLAIAGLNGKKYSRAFTSASFSLTAGTNYELSVWVKTLDAATFSVYLTGETSGLTYGHDANFVVKTATATDWTKYTFYIEVGLTSVSLKLQLGLGYDAEISGTVATADEFSAGTVLFDNVTLHSTLTTEEFDALTDATLNYDVERKLSYLADGFDSASATVASRSKLSSASNWTGAVGTDQDSASTASGVVYNDASYLPTYDVDADDAADDLYKDLVNTSYVSLFGKEYKLADYAILQTEIEAARATYPGKTDTEIETILKKLKLYDDQKKNYITSSELLRMTDNAATPADVSATIGKSFLVINNIEKSAYTYTSSAHTLTGETCYRVSVWARTYNASANATVQLYLGGSDESDNPLSFKLTGTTGWTKYTFYVQAPEDNVSSVTVKLSLGEYDADDESKLASGYAMFDAIEFEIVDQAEYDVISAESKKETPDTAIFDKDVMAVRAIPEASETGDTEKDTDTTVTPDTSFNLDYLWWMIPTILLALATIAVVVVFFVKKFRKPKKAAEDAEVENSEAIDEKHSKYEDYNE